MIRPGKNGWSKGTSSKTNVDTIGDQATHALFNTGELFALVTSRLGSVRRNRFFRKPSQLSTWS